jgi:hypothetical protein
LTDRGNRPTRRLRLGAAMLGALAVGILFTSGIASAASGGAHYAPGRYPPGCDGWDQCSTLAPLVNGDGLLTVTVFGNVNAAPLTYFEIGSGTPVTVLRPRGICHSHGKSTGLTGPNSEFITRCEEVIQPGHSAQFCEAGLTSIKNPEFPTIAEDDAGPYLYNVGANEIWPVGGQQKCQVSAKVAKPKPHHRQ